MKLSGQITPNEKGITDKYAYGWKLLKKLPAKKIPSSGCLFRPSSDCSNSGKPFHKSLILYNWLSDILHILYFNVSWILMACKYVYYLIKWLIVWSDVFFIFRQKWQCYFFFFFRGIHSMEAENQYLLYYKWGALSLLSSLGENALLMPEVGE